MVLINLIGTIVIVALIAFGVYWYLTHSKVDISEDDKGTLAINKESIQDLVLLCSYSITAYLRQDFANQNLSEQEFNNKTAAKKRLRLATANATFRDPEAQAVLREYIKSIITTNAEHRISEGNIDKYIPFDNPDALTPQEKFLILLEAYQRRVGSKSLDTMFTEFGWKQSAAKNITDQMVEEAYAKAANPAICMEENITQGLTEYTYDEKLSFLSQEILQRMYCLGVPDRLFDTDIDEIDLGVSGIPSGSFQITNAMIKGAKYSYDAIWILYHGYNVHLSCLSCRSNEEIERICENSYRYNAQHTFSMKKGFVISSMKNGSRVVVIRPPFADKFALFVRKFDSAPMITPETLIVGNGNEIVRILSEWFIRGQRNLAITGQQGTGKTTMLKAFVSWIENLNIRVQEIASELNLSYTYPEKNIVSLQETDTVDAQTGLNVQKKMNGSVNIIGEVADAVQASHIIQTANVASLYALFTHHAKNTAALVNMIALNLLQIGLYKEKRDAVEISAQTLNINVHLENTDSYRHIEFIDEIIPVTDQLYPSQRYEAQYGPLCADTYTEEMHRWDDREYKIRETDRHLFEVNNIVKWNRIPGDKDARHGFYTLEHMPSDETLHAIRNVLTDPEMKQRFDDDMIKVQEIDKEIRNQFGKYLTNNA